MILIANIFPKLRNVKSFVRPLSKKRHLRTCFDRQHVKASEILAKFPCERFHYAFSSFSGKLISEMSPLGLREILGVFVNTLTADGMYPVHECKNFTLPIQMQLPQQRKSF